MLLLSPVLLLLLRYALSAAGQGVDSGGYNYDHHHHHGFALSGGGSVFDSTDPCLVVSPPCLSETDRYSLEALMNIHREMDDDQDGGIEVEESVEFIIEDMKQQQTNKHSHLHREDQHITVEELWRGWKSSEVHNWTQEDVLRWLREFVELPQYERNFKDFKVSGNTLPRIAANEPSFLSGQLKVLEQRDKQKLNIKALDVVLFGPPTRPPHNYLKDFLLIVSVVMGVGGCWFARVQNKASKVHISKMIKDLESLQRAEQSLQELQEQLEQAQEEKRNVAEEKQYLEEKMRDEIQGAQEEAHRLYQLRDGAVSELSRLRYAEEELEQVRGALKRAEKDMQACWSNSEGLQLWMQLTHEIEVQHYNVKKHSAELQLAIAKEEAEKIKKKRSSVLGTLHVAHSSSLDQVDHKILGAKNALCEVTACLRERLHRWQQIERLSGFPILRNPGLASLTATLYSDPNWVLMPRVSVPPCSHGSLEDLMDDPGSTASASPSPGGTPHHPLHGPSIKRSPRSHSSSLCHSHHSCSLAQSPTSSHSSDPDILIPARPSYPCFEEEEERESFFHPLIGQEKSEMMTDSEFVDPRKPCREDNEAFSDLPVRSSKEKLVEVKDSLSREPLESPPEVPTRKMTRVSTMDGTLESPTGRKTMDWSEGAMDKASMKIHRIRSEASLDRNELQDELQASAEIPPRKTAVSTDGSYRKLVREGLELPLHTGISRKLSRESMGTSLDTGSKRLARDKEEFYLDSPLGTSVDTGSIKFGREKGEFYLDSPLGTCVDTGSVKFGRETGEFYLDSPGKRLPMEKRAETVATPTRKISREELEFSADTSSRKTLPRGKMDVLLDSSSRMFSRERPEFGPETSSRRISRDEQETTAGSQRRRVQREMIDSSLTTPTGRSSWDKMDSPLEAPTRKISREDFMASECISLPGHMGQPDLTLTSLMPWKSTFDHLTSGPLSQLVYDGILEKSDGAESQTRRRHHSLL
ncbi:uncharacterized protein FYW47_004792 [Aplochiton taeniatus]